MFQLVGFRDAQPHRAFLLFILISFFMIHASAVGADFDADKSSQIIMEHSSMHTIIALHSATLNSPYAHMPYFVKILLCCYVFSTPIKIGQKLASFRLSVGLALGMRNWAGPVINEHLGCLLLWILFLWCLKVPIRSS